MLDKLQLFIVGIAALAATAAWGQVTTVVGKNDPSVDAAAVQRAVDQGGTVLLKGAFDFGEKESIRITRDVELAGEPGAAGKPGTVIKGGQASIRSLPPERATMPAPKISIRDIHFDSAAWTPILIGFASSTVVTGNLFTRVKPAHFPGSDFSGGRPHRMQHAIVVGGIATEPGTPLGRPSAIVSGRVSITGNEIDLSNDTPKETLGIAIFVIHTRGSDAEIAANTVRNASRNAIEVSDNLRGADGSGRVVIRDNRIETPAEGVTIPSPRTPNGMVAGYYVDPSAATDPARAIPHSILRNAVRARGQTAASSGITALTDGAEIIENHVTLEGPGTWGMIVAGSGNRIERNRIEGSGTFGVVIGPVLAPMAGSDNRLNGNELSGLKTSRADLMILKGANGNRVTGAGGTIADAGERNAAEGFKPVSGR